MPGRPPLFRHNSKTLAEILVLAWLISAISNAAQAFGMLHDASLVDPPRTSPSVFGSHLNGNWISPRPVSWFHSRKAKGK
jgi:hypothetical protein